MGCRPKARIHEKELARVLRVEAESLLVGSDGPVWAHGLHLRCEHVSPGRGPDASQQRHTARDTL